MRVSTCATPILLTHILPVPCVVSYSWVVIVVACCGDEAGEHVERREGVEQEWRAEEEEHALEHIGWKMERGTTIGDAS